MLANGGVEEEHRPAQEASGFFLLDSASIHVG